MSARASAAYRHNQTNQVCASADRAHCHERTLQPRVGSVLTANGGEEWDCLPPVLAKYCRRDI